MNYELDERDRGLIMASMKATIDLIKQGKKGSELIPEYEKLLIRLR